MTRTPLMKSTALAMLNARRSLPKDHAHDNEMQPQMAPSGCSVLKRAFRFETPRIVFPAVALSPHQAHNRWNMPENKGLYHLEPTDKPRWHVPCLIKVVK